MSLRFPTLLGCAGIAVLSVACGMAPDEGTTSESALNEPAWTPHKPADPASCPGTAVAGKLSLYLIPPPVRLDWSTPNRLIGDAIRAEIQGGALERQGKVGLGHSIGHVHMQLDCGEHSVPLTGQTGGSGSWQSALDGFGMLLRAFEGSMDAATPASSAKIKEDVRLREQNGLISKMSFLVNEGVCKRVKEFHDEYVARRAYRKYGGHFRGRRFEGAGCAIWGADVLDVAGLLRRSVYTPVWTQSMMVGEGRFSNLFGADHYEAGSNLVWRGPDGESVIWPAGVDIPTSGWPIWPASRRLSSWTGPEDDAFGITEARGPLERQLPFSIYDPMLMNDWAERVWSDANAHGAATSMETTWTASTNGRSHEITTDAHCTQAQTIPFDRDNDDLFKDSDEP
ncbi:MAG: hypothetical protein KIT84_02850 [Labilithrix sp.]|nr:hypothetical protein [Labilithrix sp.]MCW5809920.1 hypothetical protein [Labilithrix sp.]